MTQNSLVALFPEGTWIGRTLGGVRIEEVFTASERAVVCRGVQEPIGRAVVLKLLPALSDDARVRDRQLREVQVLSQLRHPNVVTLYHVGLHDQRYPYYITEYLPGGTLRAVLAREGALRATRALGLISQLASALEELHRLGMIHRKVSPDNVLLEELIGSRQELAKVSGFGLTGRIDDDPRAGSGRGAAQDTLAASAYASPEQVLGAEVTPSADLYACGVLLFEMLTNRLPYPNAAPPLLWDDIVNSPTPSIARELSALGMHAPIQQLLNKLLAKQPSARLSSARKLRLLTIRLREDLLALKPEESSRSNDQFPVLVTAARLKALPRDALGAELAELLGELNEPPLTPADRTADDLDDLLIGHTRDLTELSSAELMTLNTPVESEQLTVSVEPAEFEHITWITPVPQRAERARGQRYALLAALSHRGERLTWRFADGAEVLLDTSLADGTRLLAVSLPIHPERWLLRMAQRARLDEFAVGLATGASFEGPDSRPDPFAVAHALLGARAARRGDLIASAMLVDAERLQTCFEPFIQAPERGVHLLRFRAR